MLYPPKKSIVNSQLTINCGEGFQAVIPFEIEGELTDEKREEILTVVRGDILLLLALQRDFPEITIDQNRSTLWVNGRIENETKI